MLDLYKKYIIKVLFIWTKHFSDISRNIFRSALFVYGHFNTRQLLFLRMFYFLFFGTNILSPSNISHYSLLYLPVPQNASNNNQIRSSYYNDRALPTFKCTGTYRLRGYSNRDSQYI